MTSAREIEREIQTLGTPERAKTSAWFFKTGKGQYGEGDVFVGVPVPVMRTVAKKHQGVPLDTVRTLLQSKIHEVRFVALEILVFKFEKATTEKERKQVYTFYLKHRSRVNNWDLVDTSAPYIVGQYLLGKDTGVLYRLEKARSLWDRRISIVATLGFIRAQHYTDTLALALLLREDAHDLIHKAVGWMLREVGKQDEPVLREFLHRYAGMLPRTTLRYAIERFSKSDRQHYMAL